MAHEAAPAYQWYVKEWRSSRAVQRMTFAQRGMYREMLDEQWERFSLPDCPHACADLLGGTDEEWVANWPVLRRKFVDRRAKPRKEHEAIVIPVDYDPSRRIINVRLEKQRRERHSYKKEKSVAGQKGGEARARNIRARNTLPAVADVAVLQTAVAEPSIALAKRSSSSSSSTASASASSSASAGVPPDARSKRPIFVGQRLTVFEWMLDDCIRTLGPHLDGFGLDAWFDALDQQAVAANLVLPKRDNGEWLQSQLVAEAQRRGLPLKFAVAESAPTLGKLATRMAAMVAGSRS